MSDIVKAIVDLRQDVKTLIHELKEVNNHLGTLEKTNTLIEKLTSTLERNEPNLEKLLTELGKLNKTTEALSNIAKELG